MHSDDERGRPARACSCNRLTDRRRPRLAFAAIAGAIVLGLVLSLAGANAGADEGAAVALSNRAVEGVGLSASIPFYAHSVVSEGGWRDEPRRVSDRVGASAALVVPLGEAFGARFSLDGAWGKASIPSSGIEPNAEFVEGALGLGVALFWRNPRRGKVGLAYDANFAFDDFTEFNRGTRLGASGVYFCGDFDLGGAVGWLRGKAELRQLGPSITSENDGVNLNARSTWYAADPLSLSLVGSYTHFGERALSGATDSGSVSGSFNWLPPLGSKRWLVLGAGFGYTRAHRRASGISLPRSSNGYSISARLQLVLPGVVSLKQLARHY